MPYIDAILQYTYSDHRFFRHINNNSHIMQASLYYLQNICIQGFQFFFSLKVTFPIVENVTIFNIKRTIHSDTAEMFSLSVTTT